MKDKKLKPDKKKPAEEDLDQGVPARPPKKTPPEGLSNSDKQRWMRENRV